MKMYKYILFMIMFSFCGNSVIYAQNSKGDHNPIGYIYFEDQFDWVSSEFGGQDYLNGKFANAGPRIDGVPQQLKGVLEATGWKTTGKFVYLRLGYLQVGRRTDGGDIISPRLEKRMPEAGLGEYSCAGIEPGKEVNVDVSFDVAIYQGVKGNKDLNTILVEVLNAGKLKDGSTEKEIKVNSWNKWKKIVVPVYGATSDTQILVRSIQVKNTGKAARFFLDNFKVVKVK